MILDGTGWLSMKGAAPVQFRPGDVVVIPQGDAYRMLSAPDQRPEFPGAATIGFLREMAAGRLPFEVTEGGRGPARTRYICGYLGCDMRRFNPVLAALPRLLLVRRTGPAGPDLLDRLLELTLAQHRDRVPGGESIRMRLAELIFVEAIRRHLGTLPAAGTGWLAGLRNPAVGRALALIHADPARPWTVETLARAAGTSRAVLARRFALLVGCPPLRYLARWRMQCAARILDEPSVRLVAVAQAVGYASEAAFSRAFKQDVGRSPASWRRHAAARGDVIAD